MDWLRIILRGIARKPVYYFITLGGFSIAITAALLIFLWVFDQLSWDKSHSGYNRIYRVLTLSSQGGRIVKSATCYRPVAASMKTDYPQIEAATYISYSSEDSPLSLESGDNKIEALQCWTNEDFFRIFDGFEFLEGTPESAFTNPDNVVLTEETAFKVFGTGKALGAKVISDKYQKEIFTVSAVVRIPAQSHINFGFMLPDKNSRYSKYSQNWSDRWLVRVYIRLRKDAQIDNNFINQLSDHISHYSRITDKLVFQPLSDVHLYSDYEDNFNRNAGNIRYVLIFSALALLIILMASFNFTVLSIARASSRSVEIGIRKMNGATRRGIFFQFMKESSLQTLTSTIAALLLTAVMLPFFNTIASERLTFRVSIGLLASLLVLAAFISSISGLYPSLYLSSFNPIGVFRRGSQSGSKRNFISLLVTVQFSIAIFFIICTILFSKQLNYIRNKDLGLKGENIAVIPTGLWYDNSQFKQELLKNPFILSASASTYAPIDVGFIRPISLNHLGRTDTVYVNYYFVDEDFAETYDIKIVKGEFLQMSNAAYWEEMGKSGRKNEKEYAVSIPIVINETAEKMLGLKDPVGQRLGNDVIVGVAKDFNFRSLYYPIEPLIMTNNPEAISYMNVRIAPGNVKESLEYIRDVYMKNREGREFSYRFFDEILDEKYNDEKRLKNMTVAFGVLAIVISILGILGMASFSIDRRTKEIGLRKISGGTSAEILYLLNFGFIKWVALAFIIAAPPAWLILNGWLRDFVYKTGLSWWIFILAGIIACVVALITVSWQSWRAASGNPVEALRYE